MYGNVVHRAPEVLQAIYAFQADRMLESAVVDFGGQAVFEVGVLLWEMVVGFRPVARYPADRTYSPEDVCVVSPSVQALLDAEGYPEEFVELVRRMVAFDAGKRPSLGAALQQFEFLFFDAIHTVSLPSAHAHPRPPSFVIDLQGPPFSKVPIVAREVTEAAVLGSCREQDFEVLERLEGDASVDVFLVRCLAAAHPIRHKLYALKAVKNSENVTLRGLRSQYEAEFDIMMMIGPDPLIVRQWATFVDVLPEVMIALMADADQGIVRDVSAG